MSETEPQDEAKPKMFASNDFHRPSQPTLNARALGGILLLVGALICYWQFYLPLQAAKAHSSETIEYDATLQMLGIITIPLGIFLLALGPKVPMNGLEPGVRGQWRWYQLVLGIALAIAAFAFDGWMKSLFASYGYGSR